MEKLFNSSIENGVDTLFHQKRLADLKREEEIDAEKRKRLQIYTALDCLFSGLSYFDFFSYDAFKIARRSKYFAQAFEKNLVTTEFLLFAFLTSSLGIEEILAEYNITVKSVGEVLATNAPKRKKNFFSFLKFWPFYKATEIDTSIKYSSEVHFLFEKASENALTRFKTPVITPEILFITIMEEKSIKVSKVIKSLIHDETKWYLLRYKLMKRIYSDEFAIRNNIIINQQYFAYLLKIQLSQVQFDRLLENDLLALGVSYFRNKLFLKLIGFNSQAFFEHEIYKSMKLTANRKYSKKKI